MSGDGLIIVGGSHAGLQIAASAREAGYAGAIRLVSEENSLPYQRPPLSKGFLLGKVPEAALPLRAEAFYRENAIEPLLGRRAVAIDRGAKSLLLQDGMRLPYDRLALATGARAKSLEVTGGALDGVLTLRTIDDARVIRARLSEIGSAVIIGGGFIGLEIAATLAALGKEVAVIEAQSRLLARAASAPLADFLAETHRRRGVRLLFRTTVTEIGGERQRVRWVRCSDGSVLPAELVIVGIGVAPDIDLAASAGLPCPDGIAVDALARTADPAVLAAGDCTCHPSAYAGGPLRLESVQNAIDQARTAGVTAAGAEKPYRSVPWFWSDQYELKLQMAGLARGYDAAVTRGSAAESRFSIYYFRGGDLVAVDSVNRAGDHMLARKLLAARARITPAEAADPSVDLGALLDK